MESEYAHDHDDWRDEWLSKKGTNDVASKPYCHTLPNRDETLWPACEEYLLRRNLSPDTAKANHWYGSRNAGDNYPRIVMPATSHQDGNHFWQARLITTDINFPNSGIGSKPDDGIKPRYQSPYGCASGDAVIVVYPVGPIRWMESVVVEGPMCALAAAETGRLGIALMGSRPPEARLELTAKLVRGTIGTVIPDSDAFDAAVDIFAYLANQGVTCRVLDPFPHKDFANMSPEARTQLLR